MVILHDIHSRLITFLVVWVDIFNSIIAMGDINILMQYFAVVY